MFSDKYCLTIWATLLLIIKLFCIEGFLKSKYLYFNLLSSDTLSSSFIYIGGVWDLLRTLSSVADISISPVAMLGFLACLSRTIPFTAITYSEPNFSAFSNASLLTSASNIIWLIPLISLKSTNTNPPKFLFFWTQPFRITSSPTLSILRSPQ